MRFETTVPIAADAERIWKTWVDVERWPEWTTSIDSVERLDAGEFGVGSRARVKQPKMRAAVWEVTELEPNRSFVWQTRSGGVTMVAGHVIEPGTGSSTATLTLDLTGPLAGLLGRLMGKRIRSYLQAEADGVKAHCES